MIALLYDWWCANCLSINTGKTEFIVFRPPRHNKYLGLILDSKLIWKPHNTELCKILGRAVGR